MENPQFKAGDVVTYISDRSNVLKNGQNYVVADVSKDGRICKLVGIGFKYYTDKFIPFVAVEAPKPPPAPKSVLKPKPIPVPVKKTLVEALENKVSRGICSFAFEFSTGYRYFVEYGPCHASMRLWDKEGCGTLDTCFLAVKRHIAGDGFSSKALEHYKRAITYIIKDSPWKDIFLPVEMDYVFEHGVFLDTNKGINECVCAAVALRSCSEHSKHNEVFCKLLDMGVNPNVSYLLAHCLNVADDGRYRYDGQRGGHHILDTEDKSGENILKFFKTGVFKKPSAKPYKHAFCQNYIILESMYGSYRASMETFSDLMRKHAAKFYQTVENSWGGEGKYLFVKGDKELLELARIVENMMEKV